jgi:hypothetical protein
VSLSLRTRRAQVFAYADVGTDGVIDSVYTPILPSDGTDAWWCSEGYEGMGESTVARSPEHTMQGVFVFSDESPFASLTPGVNYALLIDGGTYHVRSVRPARYGTNELIVSAERVVGLDLTTT